MKCCLKLFTILRQKSSKGFVIWNDSSHFISSRKANLTKFSRKNIKSIKVKVFIRALHDRIINLSVVGEKATFDEHDEDFDER